VNERTGDTKTRIKDVALELFTNQGYEQTSLREIAERLGVTKAALYYHFKSKEEIVESIANDRLATVDELIQWARTQPPGQDTRREILRRHQEQIRQPRHRMLVRFFERNQPALAGLSAGLRLRDRMAELLQTMTGPNGSPVDELRNGLALYATHTTWFWLSTTGHDDDERINAALVVAAELIEQTGDTATAVAPQQVAPVAETVTSEESVTTSPLSVALATVVSQPAT